MNVKEIVKLGISLFMFCAVAALALGFTNELTKGQIAAQRAAKELKAKQEVLPEAKDFKDVEANVLSDLQAKEKIIQSVSIGVDDAGEAVGYVVKSTPNGFGGPIVVITGLTKEGIITGVRIGSNTESPGLGSKAKEPAFYEQYNDKTAAIVKVNKGTPGAEEIQAITSSTITSKAVTRGVNASAIACEMGQ